MLLSKIKILLLISICFPQILFSQFIIDKPIIFTDLIDSNRTIDNLSIGNRNDNAVASRQIVQTDALNHTITINQMANISINYQNLSYTDGMTIIVSSDSTNQGAVFVNINGLGIAEILLNGNSLTAGLIFPKDILELVYSGGNFHWINSPINRCPYGYKKVNEKYCIEKDERFSAPFFTATQNCYNDGGKLCSWSEFTNACQDTSLNLNNMTGNWEWIDDSQDHSNNATGVGLNCGRNKTFSYTLSINYRCCYYLK